MSIARGKHSATPGFLMGIDFGFWQYEIQDPKKAFPQKQG